MLEQDEQYVVSDTETEMSILDTPLNLMKELIKAQLETMSTINYMEIIKDKIEYIREQYHDDPDAMNNLNNLIMDISHFFISEICEKFNLTYAADKNPEDQLELASAMYYALVLNYRKNVRKYLKNHIQINRKELAEQYNSKKKDVTTTSTKKKVKNREMVTIVANLPIVVRDILSVIPTVEEYFEAFTDVDNEIIFDAFNNLELGGDLDTYLSMLVTDFEDILSSITYELKEKLTS